MKNNLPNLLTASSILLGVITALYGLFLPAIQASLNTKPKKHSIDNKRAYYEVMSVFKTKYIPLIIGSLMITLICLPELFNQLVNSYRAIQKNGIENTKYDTLSAAFISVCLFMAFISINLILIGVKLLKKINNLHL